MQLLGPRLEETKLQWEVTPCLMAKSLCNNFVIRVLLQESSALKKEIKQLKEELLQRLDEKFSKGKESNKNSDHDFFHTSSHCIVRNLTSTYCRFRLDIECFNLCSTTVLIAIRSHFILLLLLLSQPYRVKMHLGQLFQLVSLIILIFHLLLIF